MKHSTKPVFLCLFTVLFSGCLPHEKLTGRVIDLMGPVPETAVLGMLWIEDADKAKPALGTKDLKLEDRDAALEKDMKSRGLPVAYARAFSDKNGWFTLDKLHFSAETKKAVKAMKQPKITRVTIWAFQRGYRKQAVTMFPKTKEIKLPAATMMLARPADWKELYVDNIVDTLTQDYMLKGYSKEFGATKAEKSWIFEYTQANEQRAYDTSDIKSDKKMEELCGHDYSDIIVSTAGIQRNPNHEKCGELLKRIGAIREVKELWIGHSNTKQDPLAAAKEVVKQALNTLSAKTTEPKEYEAMILTGLEDAGKIQGNDAMRNGLGDQTWQDDAKLLYGKGDKAAAYKALGYALYEELPAEIQQGILTAQLTLIAVPGIKDTAAGFYLLMTKPLTAQLPNGDNGNHKDKPGYKVEGATETVKALRNGDSSAGNSKEAVQAPESNKQKTTGTNVGSTVVKVEPKRGHIERVKEKGHEVIRFFDKDGKRIKELNLEKKDIKIIVSRSKRFYPLGFKVNISTWVAEVIENARKEFGRDIELYRQESHWSSLSGNGKFMVITDDYADYVELADANDSERADGATEIRNITTIYDLEGNKIIELPKEEGWQPVISNTGQFFVVTVGEYERHRIVNRNKKIIAEFEYHVGNKFFSENDVYILMTNKIPDSDLCELTVFNTRENRLELKKTILPWNTFQGIEKNEIFEDTRIMVIHYSGESRPQGPRVNTVHF